MDLPAAAVKTSWCVELLLVLDVGPLFCCLAVVLLELGLRLTTIGFTQFQWLGQQKDNAIMNLEPSVISCLWFQVLNAWDQLLIMVWGCPGLTAVDQNKIHTRVNSGSRSTLQTSDSLSDSLQVLDSSRWSFWIFTARRLLLTRTWT
jgi:hypothetical protein